MVLQGLTPFLFDQKLYKYGTVLYIVVLVCHGLCDNLKCEKTTRPIYDNHRRCKVCEVYYTKDVTVCPCCSSGTRCRPHNKVNRERYNNKTIRITNHETRHLHSTMLRT